MSRTKLFLLFFFFSFTTAFSQISIDSIYNQDTAYVLLYNHLDADVSIFVTSTSQNMLWGVNDSKMVRSLATFTICSNSLFLLKIPLSENHLYNFYFIVQNGKNIKCGRKLFKLKQKKQNVKVLRFNNNNMYKDYYYNDFLYLQIRMIVLDYPFCRC